ncbi:MAG TPA: hypothetical protein VI282_19370 [Verrucomicrobiae bacterium]
MIDGSDDRKIKLLRFWPQRPTFFAMIRWFVLLLVAVVAQGATVESKLEAYRAELDAFRAEYGGSRELPDVRFFLFGMGLRPKFIYRDGKLIDVRNGVIVRQWKIKSDVILPPEYRVVITKEDGNKLQIAEDEQAIWITDATNRVTIGGSEKPIKLPFFEENKYSQILRVLHQELLINTTPEGPLPNLFVYRKPWYRDGSMMAMALQKTGNLRSIRDWIVNLRDPFDRNNAGETEADNLGQALYLISLVSDKKHPLVQQILLTTKQFEAESPNGKYIRGRSDFAEHPVYQTKWLKYGLRALSINDTFGIPEISDSYSALFWMDYRDAHVFGKDAADRDAYPYLGWANDHFHKVKKSPISNRDYPLTWERNASQADYNGMSIIGDAYVKQKLAAPHTWHAAEVFLYLLDQK